MVPTLISVEDLEKRRARDRARYNRNKAVRQAAVAEHKRKLRQEFDTLKSDPCTDCGHNYPPYVMQWDHRPGEVKIGCVTDLVRNGNRLKALAEIAKCDLVCANCHAERTHQRGLK